MKFDIILGNPPFNLGEKMLIKWFDIANEICTVQPSTWLLGKKQKKDIVRNVDAWEKTEIESIQGSEHFDAGISGEIAIQHFIKGKENENNSHYDKQIIFNGKQYNKCEEINKFSNDELLMEFKNIVEPLYLKDNLQNHIKSIPNVHVFGNAVEEKNPNQEWWVFRITRFSVHPDGKHTNWCIISKNQLIPYKFKNIKNLKEKNGNNFLKYYIPFNNKETVENLLNYIQTDFCRCCLYLIQTSYELGRGECNYIPWFDFSDPVFSKSPTEIDNALFKKYNISDKIRKHIEEILPDYYKIRNISYE